MRATDTWTAILGDLQLLVTRPVYETWLRDTVGLSLTDDTFMVRVPTAFGMEWLERRMYQLIEKTARKVTNQPVQVRFQVGTTIGPDEGPCALFGADHDRTPITPVRPPAFTINRKYTFSSFVVGSSNQLPYNAAQAVAEAPGQSYNPLFIYSGVGLGKTHLLHAIGHTCVSRGLNFIYVTGEQFTNDFISAIRTRTTEQFRTKYRGAGLLLIDDIQFISGKEQTQEGFFHTFNDLHDSNRQVVMTSDRLPGAMSRLEDRLRSRFGWGLIADIQPPELETRIAILRSKAEQLSVSFPGDVLEYIAKKVQNNVRELEGSLNRIVALTRFAGRPITLESAALALADIMPTRPRSTDHNRLIEEVSTRFKVSYDDLVGPRRTKPIALARQVAMYLLREELGMSLSEIGRLFGGRNHTTVINAMNKVNQHVRVDHRLRQDILDIRGSLSVADR